MNYHRPVRSAEFDPPQIYFVPGCNHHNHPPSHFLLRTAPHPTQRCLLVFIRSACLCSPCYCYMSRQASASAPRTLYTVEKRTQSDTATTPAPAAPARNQDTSNSHRRFQAAKASPSSRGTISVLDVSTILPIVALSMMDSVSLLSLVVRRTIVSYEDGGRMSGGSTIVRRWREGERAQLVYSASLGVVVLVIRGRAAD